jgi:signal transduction histidine kinase
LQMDRRKPETEQTSAHLEQETEFRSDSPVLVQPSNNRRIAGKSRPLNSSVALSPQNNPVSPNSPVATPTENLTGLIHDARTMVSAMDLYCDLLAEPEVLSAPYRHYADELRLIGNACRQLLERMAAGGSATQPEASLPPGGFLPSSVRQSPSMQASKLRSNPAQYPVPGPPSTQISESLSRPGRSRVFLEAQPVENLAEELLASRNLLSALTGPGITLSMSISSGHWPISMTRDDLTRVMVNLVRNAAEAMPGGGRIRIELKKEAGFLSLSIEDSGTGIPNDSLEKIFVAGYSTHSMSRYKSDSSSSPSANSWPVRHRGLGLSIVRSIINAAGATVRAFNRIDFPTTTGSQQVTDKPHAMSRGALDNNSENNPEVHGAVILIEFPHHESPVASS